ncbi:MAG: restriction endonuclease [Eubacteriaceae bacterium]|nr:restriction endonuclease [Eubacteriaceae bacterium]
MNLYFDVTLAEGYNSASQSTRRLTENWVGKNMFCPRCGNEVINHMKNNSPVGDFICPRCDNQYELKSKGGKYGKKVIDGAYETMIKRITGSENPDFFFISYSSKEYKVNDMFLVPKHFFTPNIVEKRNPLSPKAKRAGWVGCNILLDQIPREGIIDIISNGIVNDSITVLAKTNRAQSLETSDLSARGWLMDILLCVNKINTDEFSLSDMYAFEPFLFARHPHNNNIKPKIRQQLQMLREKGFIEFLGNGKYRKVPVFRREL